MGWGEGCKYRHQTRDQKLKRCPGVPQLSSPVMGPGSARPSRGQVPRIHISLSFNPRKHGWFWGYLTHSRKSSFAPAILRILFSLNLMMKSYRSRIPRDQANFPLEPVLYTGLQHRAQKLRLPEHSQGAQNWAIVEGPQSRESPTCMHLRW